MIVTWSLRSKNLILREVETEEEAFYEMRRFLEVNNVKILYVEVVSQPTHKYVGMYEHCAAGFGFRIYNENSTNLLVFEPDEDKWEEGHKDFFEYYSSYYRDRQKDKKAYDRAMAYFNDLKKRKGGE